MANILKFDRDQMLKSIALVFQEKGYNGTSMQDIVDITNLNRSSIYNSFGSKMALYLEALDVYKNDIIETSSKTISNAQCGLEAIQLLFRFHISRIINDNEGKGCMISNCKSELGSSGDKSIKKWLKNSESNNISLLEELVLNGQESGSINKNKSPAEYALYLFSSIQGLNMTGIFFKERKSLEDLVNNILYILK
jgi:TetR/AcrR family transcriptional repressor of nem operon